MTNNLRINQDEQLANSRGHPPRHKSERMKVIAWYHAMLERAAVDSTGRLADTLNGGEGGVGACLVDDKTLYRYRRGTSTPTAQRIRYIDGVLPGTKDVFDTGPDAVPLWAAMWGPSSPIDWQLAEALMPGGRWPQASLTAMFFDDEFLGRLMEFRGAVLMNRDLLSLPNADLLTLATAIRIYRVHSELGRAENKDLHDLMWGAEMLPGVQDALSTHGIRDDLKTWIAAQRAIADAEGPHPEAPAMPWSIDREQFYRMSEQAGQRWASAGQALNSYLSESQW